MIRHEEKIRTAGFTSAAQSTPPPRGEDAWQFSELSVSTFPKLTSLPPLRSLVR